ncbi:MAG TPA: SIMPL domain-containing protein [Anaerolineales bacterium]|nr:SIMPL domain-containing protein [Anaerolineales bacterium]
MRTKLLVPTVLLIAAALLSACSGSIQFGQAQPRTINVTGNAQVILAPDIAYISIGVHTEAQTAKDAVASSNTQTQAVIDAIKAQGVDAKDVQTTNFSVYQQIKTGPNGENQGTYFSTDNTVYVTMRDLTKIGGILDASIAAGANNIYGITFDVLDKEAATQSGRDQAIADAKAQAEQLAKGAGATLGAVQSITYYSNVPTPIYYDTKAAPAGVGGGGSVPISSGQLTLTVSVNVTYGLK